MSDTIIKRTTLIVRDAEKSRRFYKDVLGWSEFYGAELEVTGKIIPAPSGRVQLYIMQGQDPEIGKIGILQWVDPELPDPGEPKQRLGIGDVVLVADVDDIQALNHRVEASQDARVCSPPRDFSFPAPDGSGDIELSAMSFFDPDDFLHEVYYRHNRPNPEGYLIRRTTTIVRDMDATIAFYRDALGMEIYQDNTMQFTGMELPAGEPGAMLRLTVFKCQDPYIGMLGGLQIMDPPLEDPGSSTWDMGIGSVVFVGNTQALDKVWPAVESSGVRITGRPYTRTVPKSGGEGVIHMSSIGFFDPDGQLMEVNQRSEA